ncbi:MAG: hypothetical protein HOF20_08625 [Pelagibacteraceae bacterium]|jgi:recombinational DNA repair protein (RecF pathway)|nr:hypothetical protein [Pelagibacteraceae bacterium]MBT4645828.1 hypothetical protein [Pelagibacteraceae bacterium]
MIEKKALGILLFNKISSENNLFLKFLTENDEIVTGLCFGGASKKKKNIYQIGYFLSLNIKKKNNNFPNTINAELAKPYYNDIFNDKYKLHCLLAIVSLLNLSIIEGQKVNGLYSASKEIIQIIAQNEKWIIDFFLYLLKLLKLIGYEIEFNKNLPNQFFNLETLQFEEAVSLKSVKFPHSLLKKKEKIDFENVNSFFKIFEAILQTNHLNNMNLAIPINYLNFKKIILNFLRK